MKLLNKKTLGTMLCTSMMCSFIYSVPVSATPAPIVPSASVTTDTSYRLHPGDQLQIIVYGHPELSSNPTGNSSQYIIRPDGNLSFPLIGTISTANMTVEQLQQTLARNFATYVRNPNVSVNLTHLGTTRVYVLGEIQKPGLYEITKSHRVLDALGIAGGFTQKSAKKKIYLIRNGSTTPELLNINDFFTKGDQSQNVELHEGDALYLTSNGKIDIVRDVLPFISSAYYVTRFNKD